MLGLFKGKHHSKTTPWRELLSNGQRSGQLAGPVNGDADCACPPGLVVTENCFPPSLQKKVLVTDGIVYISADASDSPVLDSFLSYIRRRGFADRKILPAEEFQKLLDRNSEQPRSESEIQNLAVDILRAAHQCGASDIHIEFFGPFAAIKFRRLGMLEDYRQIMGETGRSLITAIYQTMCQSAEASFTPSERQDARIVSRDFLPPDVHSVRVHTEPLDCSMAEEGTGSFMALRLLYDRTEAKGSLPDRLTSLGYSEKQISRLLFLTQRSGLTLISGPTGHGKSTALKHIMECMALENPEKSFMTIEDPPEYPLERVKQVRVSTQDSGGTRRGEQYRNAIAGAMRSDPDTLMIGEIRYPEAAAAALDAAQTGHGVWSTVHANSAFGIVQRLISLLRAANYPDPLEYLCDHTVSAGLVHQRLVPLLCPQCRQPFLDVQRMDNEYSRRVLPNAVKNRLMCTIDTEKLKTSVYVRGEGCSHCNGVGIIGQTVAAEIVATDQVLLRYLRQNDLESAQTHWRREQDGRTFVEHAIELIEHGLVDPHLSELRLGVPLNFAKMSSDMKFTSAQLDELAGRR